MFPVLYRYAVQSEEIPALRNYLTRKLYRGLFLAPYPQENTQQLRAGERLRSLGKQALSGP